MNKTQLLTQHDCKLYDLSCKEDMHRMNMNERYCLKKRIEPTFKLIAPFGHPMEYKADFYYFEHENTPISEQILREMGFENHNWKVLDSFVDYEHKPSLWFDIDQNKVELWLDEESLKINVTNANQLHQLINLLK